MHIPPFDNKNKPIVDIEDSRVPLNYFNIVKLNKDQSFEYQTPGYETCIVPATGTINVEIEGIKVESLGTRTVNMNVLVVKSSRWIVPLSSLDWMRFVTHIYQV